MLYKLGFSDPLLRWVENVEESISNDAWKLAIFDKCDFVNVFLSFTRLLAPQMQIFVEVSEVGIQGVLNKFVIC